jgi:hypothetical protein
MNVTSYITKEYENKSNWAICENEPNSNPKQTQFHMILAYFSSRAKKIPEQNQYKPKQTQFQTAHLLMDRMNPKLLLIFHLKNSLTGLCNSLKYWVLYCERDFL